MRVTRTSFFAPYPLLEPENVRGTIEVLQLACAVRPKPVHFVSTLGVLAAPLASPESVDESASLDRFAHLQGGYAQSKWVAESLVRAAAARGLPVAIHRPGRLQTISWDHPSVSARIAAQSAARSAELGKLMQRR